MSSRWTPIPRRRSPFSLFISRAMLGVDYGCPHFHLCHSPQCRLAIERCYELACEYIKLVRTRSALGVEVFPRLPTVLHQAFDEGYRSRFGLVPWEGRPRIANRPAYTPQSALMNIQVSWYVVHCTSANAVLGRTRFLAQSRGEEGERRLCMFCRMSRSCRA
jgi:hypothetical protein